MSRVTRLEIPGCGVECHEENDAVRVGGCDPLIDQRTDSGGGLLLSEEMLVAAQIEDDASEVAVLPIEVRTVLCGRADLRRADLRRADLCGTRRDAGSGRRTHAGRRCATAAQGIDALGR